MSDLSKLVTNLPPEQQAIRARCFHPTGTFVEFAKEEIGQSIPERFEKMVRMYPDKVAVKYGKHLVTYHELNQAANRIAHTIFGKYGQDEAPVALLFGQDVDAIAAIVGALKAGKVYVVLDPSFPLHRLTATLEDSQANLIISNSWNKSVASKLVHDNCAMLNVDEINDSTRSDNLRLSLSPDHLANITYTSGSTGTPKGVVKRHRNFLHRAMIHSHAMGIRIDDRLSLIHSLNSGSAESHLGQCLLNGVSICLFDPKLEGVHRLASWVADEQITILHLPVAAFRQLAELADEKNDLSSIRMIHLSGAPITRLEFDLWKNKLAPRVALYLHMGSTESQTISGCFVGTDFSFPATGTPIGYPVNGKEVLILDDDGHEVRPGEIGEIAVKSRYLASEYWRKPELTGAKFRPDPSGGDKRTYLTGDLGRILPDGFLIHLGRKDLLVKIRGYRVEITEIEKAILSHPEVKDVGAVAWERESGDKQLIAYVVRRDGAAPMSDELRAFLGEKLPEYMIPSAFMFLEALPLTNGKLDRKALPKPDDKRPEMKTAYVPPRSDVERWLAEIWAGVLSVNDVGINDNFFDLGGHSLAATRVVSQIIRKFHLELPLQSLFQSPTVAAMANVITEHQRKKLGDKELARVLTELESLSDEEAQRLLADQTTTAQIRDRNG